MVDGVFVRLEEVEDGIKRLLGDADFVHLLGGDRFADFLLGRLVSRFFCRPLVNRWRLALVGGFAFGLLLVRRGRR